MSTTAFATPGEAKRSGIIDFATADGLKYFTTATKGLEPKYDLKPDGLQAFLEHIRKRAFNFGFNGALEIPTKDSLENYLLASATPPPTPTVVTGLTSPVASLPLPPGGRKAATTSLPTLECRNLLTQYGAIPMSECQAVAKTYYGTTRDRSCQNSSMLYNFVSNSITDKALTELALESSKFMISSNADGACFLKLLISKVQVDTISTVNVLRAAISKLDVKIIEYKGDVTQFHTYVKTLKASMESYGQSYPELLVNLFSAYQAIEDDDFHAYIMMRKGMWEDGTLDFNPNQLMNLVENHYKSRVENGTWKTVTKKDERIVALEAQVTALTTTAVKKGGITKEERDKKYAWKFIAPTTEAGKKEVKTFENRQYHWCTKHNSWTLHTDAECKGVGAFKNRGGQTKNNSNDQVAHTSDAGSSSTPTVRVDTALTSSYQDREPLVL
jgi:hypothetical protein